MITIGTKRFAPSAAAMVDTVFNPGGTADGFYKVRKNGVAFHKPNGDIFAFLVANPGQSQFFVTADKHKETGKVYYMYGLADGDKARLGLTGGIFGEFNTAEEVWQKVKKG